MGTLGQLLQRTWVHWNAEDTPSIYLAVTLLLALFFSVVALAFSVLVYFGLGQAPGGPLRPSFEGVIFLPPFAVLAFWLVYRYRWYKIMFWTRKQT